MAAKVRIGTRGSALARWQSDWVAAQLRERGVEVEIIRITTTGDVTSGPLGQVGGQGLFTKEIQRALLDRQVDLAVHSLKDLPTAPIAGLKLGAVPPREASGDCLVSTRYASIDALPQGAKVGTGSLRRKTQLLHWRPDLVVEDIRGNLDTRLKKLDDGEFDAILLAEAGLRRLGWESRIAQTLPKTHMLPAVGQGALGLEVRDDDDATQAAIAPLNDAESLATVVAERKLLFDLHGGCLAPVGAWARMDDGRLLLDASVLSADGKRRVLAHSAGDAKDAERIGATVARDLLAQGAAELIAQSRAGG